MLREVPDRRPDAWTCVGSAPESDGRRGAPDPSSVEVDIELRTAPWVVVGRVDGEVALLVLLDDDAEAPGVPALWIIQVLRVAHADLPLILAWREDDGDLVFERASGTSIDGLAVPGPPGHPTHAWWTGGPGHRGGKNETCRCREGNPHCSFHRAPAPSSVMLRGEREAIEPLERARRTLYPGRSTTQQEYNVKNVYFGNGHAPERG